jgi:hypothetical protein
MADDFTILDELQALNADTLLNMSRENMYFLPDEFFTDFSGNITRQIWLNSVPKKNPYHFPKDYFENLPDIILDKVVLNERAAGTLLHVPDGYFNNLAENILGKIKAKNDNVQQELEELAPLLSQLPKTNVYSAPAGYFETLAPKPVAEKEEQPAKVISIRRKTRRWFNYAAAACIAALMFGGGYYYLNENKNPQSSSSNGAIYANINVEQAISQLSDSAINSYLQNDNTDISTPQNDYREINIQSLIQNMSDEEISNYLLKNSDPNEKSQGS